MCTIVYRCGIVYVKEIDDHYQHFCFITSEFVWNICLSSTEIVFHDEKVHT